MCRIRFTHIPKGLVSLGPPSVSSSWYYLDPLLDLLARKKWDSFYKIPHQHTNFFIASASQNKWQKMEREKYQWVFPYFFGNTAFSIEMEPFPNWKFYTLQALAVIALARRILSWTRGFSWHSLGLRWYPVLAFGLPWNQTEK